MPVRRYGDAKVVIRRTCLPYDYRIKCPSYGRPMTQEQY